MRIRTETRDRLKELGKKGMTYDDVINALIRCKELSDGIRGDESEATYAGGGAYWQQALREMF